MYALGWTQKGILTISFSVYFGERITVVILP